jgi:hypothetical protein
MGKTLDFFMAMPKLCGAKNADRWAWIIENVYLAELAGGTPFDENDEDKEDFFNRMEIAFAFSASDDGVKEQCKRLAKIIYLNHKIEEHGNTELKGTSDILVKEATAAEVSYPEVASVMSVSEAQAAGWNI